MKNYNFKKELKEISVPNELILNAKKILSSEVKIDGDINQILAEFLVNDDGVLNVLSKEEMSWIDWKQLKESCKSSSNMIIENNGILMEFLCQYILPNIFNIKSLILYQEPSFESPENGNDLLFFDTDGNIFIYEVKSKISDDFSHTTLKAKIKNAYTSLFCSKEMKNHKKISIARKVTNNLEISDEVKDKIFSLLEKVEDVEGNIIDLCEDKEIFLNICIISNGFQYTELELKNDLIDSITSSVYCKSNCEYLDKDNGVCKINRLSKTIVLNIISIEFNTELNINDLNDNIIQIIDDKGLDIRC